ncbi:hypothetical protein BH24ACT5_BH24ACT5_05050 [soil metagenome]
MNVVSSLSPLVGMAVVGLVLTVGSFAAVVMSHVVFRIVAHQHQDIVASLGRPQHRLGLLLRQQVVRTERPDTVTWVLAPAAYLGLAAAALTVVPLSEGVVVADVRTGIVVFGAAEALAIVAIFLHGWSPNSPFALVAGYRFVAVALSYELLSMFVLIGAAIPAQSMSIGAIVRSQAGLWNVVRQPLGLPLFLIVALGVTFRGPLDLVDSADLAGGGSVEDSGLQRLAWTVARHAMLVVFAAAAAAVFLGGWQGPLLPGEVWMGLKTLAVLAVLVTLDTRTARVAPERFVKIAWSVLLPLAFVDLIVAGVGSL